MYTALRATSITLREFLLDQFVADSILRGLFNPSNPTVTGTMVVTLNNPDEMADNTQSGLSVWLYQVVRDEERLNAPPERLGPNLLRPAPLPLRLHYLITPLIERAPNSDTEQEQAVLGKVLQVFNDYPTLRGSYLKDDFRGTETVVSVRLEPLALESITRIWDALARPYQLSVSYEVSVVYIRSAIEQPAHPVAVLETEYGLLVGSEEGD